MVYSEGQASCPQRPHYDTQLPACSLLRIYAVVAAMRVYALNMLAWLLTQAEPICQGSVAHPSSAARVYATSDGTHTEHSSLCLLLHRAMLQASLQRGSLTSKQAHCRSDPQGPALQD